MLTLIVLACVCSYGLAWEVPGYPNASAPLHFVRIGDTVTLRCWSIGGDPPPHIWFTVNNKNATLEKGYETTTETTVSLMSNLTMTEYTFVADRKDNKKVFDCNVYNGYGLLQGPLKRSVYLMMEIPPSDPVFNGPVELIAGNQYIWTCVSAGAVPRSTVDIHFPGRTDLMDFRESWEKDPADGTFITTGELHYTPAMTDNNRALCCKVTHQAINQTSCKTLQVRARPNQPTISGPSTIKVGVQGTWFSVSTGGNPASTLQMTINGNLITSGFTTSSSLTGSNTYTTTGSLQWTPGMADVGTKNLCVLATHPTLSSPQQACMNVNVQATPDQPTISGPSIIGVGIQGTWFVESTGGNPASTLQMTLNGSPITTGFTSSSSLTGSNIYTTTGSLQWTPGMADVGTQVLCVLATHPALSSPQQACMNVDVQVPPQQPMISGPSSVTAGTTNVWTSVSVGGYPASTLKMTLDGSYITSGFTTQVSVLPGGNTYTTSGTLSWTPTSSNIGVRELCVEAHHPLLTPPQKACKMVTVEEPAPSSIIFTGPSVLTSGISATWTCTSDTLASTIEITIDGIRVTSNMNSNQVVYSGSFGVNDIGKQLCCKAYHSTLSQAISQCKTLNIQVSPQPPTLTGSTIVAVDIVSSWTCQSVGGNPAATLAMTLNGNYVINGFTQSSQVTTGNTYVTTGTLMWTPTQSNLGANELCCEASHPAVPGGSQKACKTVNVQKPPATIDLAGPNTIEDGQTATWTCTSIGGSPSPTQMTITINGMQLSSSTDSTQVAYTGSFTNFDQGKELCCVVYHPLYPVQGMKQCSQLQIQQIQIDSITLTGPTVLSSGHQGTWTCTYNGGTPTLQMTIGSSPVMGAVTTALGNDMTVLSLVWSPTQVHNNQFLCCSAINVAQPPPQCLQLQIQASTTTCQGPGDVAFALDGSDSISPNNFQIMKNFTLQNIDIFGLGENKIKVGGLVFSDNVGDFFTPTPSYSEIKTKIDNFIQPRSSTRTDLAVKKLRESILVGSRSKVAVLITDGESINRAQTLQEVALAKTFGIVFVTVGIDMKSGSGGQLELAEIASFPEANIMISDFNSLKDITEISKLRDILCQVITTTTTTTPASMTTTPQLVTQPLVSNPLCEGCVIDDGHGYNKDPSDCSKFYQCYVTNDADDSTKIMKAVNTPCPFGTFWSQVDLVCVEWVHTTCPNSGNKCLGQADMTKFTYLGCDTYWNCMGGRPIPTRCQAGHVFNGATCVSDPTNVCFNTVTVPCDLIVDTNDASKYYKPVTQFDGSVFNVHMSCPPGTEYDNARCGCAVFSNNAVIVPSDCTALIEHGVGDQFTWKQTENLIVGHSGVTFLSSPSKIVFSPESHVNIWRSAHYEYKDTFAATMTVELPAFTGFVATVSQILLNCIYPFLPTGSITDGPSISLQVMQIPGGGNMYLGQIVTDSGTDVVTVTQTTGVTGPTDIIFAYDGNNIVLKVGSQETSKPLSGDIKITQTGIVLGRGMLPGELLLDGSIANLKIYDCISQNIANSLTAI